MTTIYHFHDGSEIIQFNDNVKVTHKYLIAKNRKEVKVDG